MKLLKINLKKFIILSFVFMISIFIYSCDNKKEKTYNIIMTNATIPPLMATLDAIDNGNETYMWYGRPFTFASIDNLEKIVNIVKKEDVNQKGINADAITVMQRKVNQLYQKNKKANFRFYVTDYGVEVALRVMTMNKIPEDQYKVILLEDGNGSYTNFKDNYYNVNSIEELNNNISIVNETFEKAKNQKLGSIVEAFEGNIHNWALAVAYATRDNVEYWLQFPDMIESKDQEIKKMLDDKEIHFIKKNLTSMYSNINEDKKSTFKNIIIDDNIKNIMTFNNDKPILMITGTSYTGEQLGTSENEEINQLLETNNYNDFFEATFDYITEKYSNKYNFVLKPHPSWTPSLDEKYKGASWKNEEDLENRVDFLEEKNIKVLPGQTPAEAIMWAYPNVFLGGYNSSLYMNEQNGKTLFFIGLENASGLSSPVNELVENGTVFAGYDEDNKKISPLFITIDMIKEWLQNEKH